MRLSPHQIYLIALEGKKSLYARPLPDRKTARIGLMRLTGQDFGYDAVQWRNWIKANRKGLYKSK